MLGRGFASIQRSSEDLTILQPEIRTPLTKTLKQELQPFQNPKPPKKKPLQMTEAPKNKTHKLDTPPFKIKEELNPKRKKKLKTIHIYIYIHVHIHTYIYIH